MMKGSLVLAVVSAAFISGCAGREANIVPVVQEGDAKMSCSELRQEIDVYAQSLNRLTGDGAGVAAKNVAAATVGVIIFPPTLFLMNLKGAAKEEAKSIQDRINGLALRHNAKKCNPPIVVDAGQ